MQGPNNTVIRHSGPHDLNFRKFAAHKDSNSAIRPIFSQVSMMHIQSRKQASLPRHLATLTVVWYFGFLSSCKYVQSPLVNSTVLMMTNLCLLTFDGKSPPRGTQQHLFLVFTNCSPIIRSLIAFHFRED